MQGTVETRNLIRQFFDEPQISDEDLDSLAKVVDKRDSMLPIEELQRLIELLGESQTLLGAGKFRFINETRQSLWKATVNLFKLRLLSIATNSAPDERRCSKPASA